MKCNCEETGRDGTKNHTGWSALIGIGMVSDTKELISTCENHVDNYTKLAVSKGHKVIDITQTHTKPAPLKITSPKILEVLCSCEDTHCQKPHNLDELKSTVSELEYKTFVDDYSQSKPEIKCPRCAVDTYVYPLNGLWLAYCLACELELDIFDDLSVKICNTNEDNEDIIQEEKVIEPTAVCPTCYRTLEPAYVYQYGTGKTWEAYCEVCSINFEVDTKKIVEWIDADNPTTKKEGTVNKIAHHAMSLNSKKDWECDTCKYETAFVSDVNKHEQLLVTEDPHYTKFVSYGKWKCIYCQEDFDDFRKSMDHENEIGKRQNTWNSTPTVYKPHCVHKPQKVMDGKEEGWSVWAGRKWDCEPELHKFDIILNLSGNRIGKKHEIPFPELKVWEHGGKSKWREMALDWPDHGVVDLPKAFWDGVTKMLKKRKAKMLIFCIGGHGRTGSAIASLLVSAFNYSPKQATNWVWDSYCSEAIETDSQVQYIYGLVGEKYVAPSDEKEVKSITETSPGLF